MLFRHFSDSNNSQNSNDDKGHGMVVPSETAKRNRRVALKCGRAYRKRQLKQREEENSHFSTKIASAIVEIIDGSGTKNDKNAIADDDSDITNNDKNTIDEKKYTASNPLFGKRLSTNYLKERYILKQKKINYPKSWSEWGVLFGRTYEKYLWTFEGTLLKEKKRDDYGNVIQNIEEEDDENDPNKEEEEVESLQDKATDVASQISQNVQKNIATIKEEGPKLIQMGQEVTGISTRDELREWVGEQLKLGTACLSEFMKGYRKGRDDEVDRMLHEYFQDLDEKEEPNKNEAVEQSLDDDEVSREDSANSAKKERRSWGRRERRRLKATGVGAETTP
ncbi:hypothetical protein ACHAXR_010648 [Thalassiosira sp. AJA248-18]